MDVLHLQRVALAPELWLGRLRKQSRPPHELKDMDVMSAPATLAPTTIAQLVDGDRDGVYLVPGGRFLIAARSDDVFGFLELWDLGVPGKEAMVEPKRVAEVKMDMHGGIYGCELCACIVPGDTLRVIVAYQVFPIADELNTS
jgi:hypothetical protein